MSKEFDRKSAIVKQLSLMPPDQLANHLANAHKDMTQVAPSLAPHLQNLAVSSLNYLHSALPKPGFDPMNNEDWKPSKTQQDHWLKQHEIVSEPTKILKYIKEGTVSNSQIQALIAVHPAMAQELQQKASEYMNPKAMKKMSYQTKMALSKALQMPLDSSFLPRVVAADQATFIPQGQPQAVQKPSKGMEKVNQGKRAETTTERAERDAK